MNNADGSKKTQSETLKRQPFVITSPFRIILFFVCCSLSAATYDHSLTQFGSGYIFFPFAAYGQVSAIAGSPIFVYPASAFASAGYHDTMVIFDGNFGKTFQMSGNPGLLNISYEITNLSNPFGDEPGGGGGTISATGFTYIPPPSDPQFASLMVPSAINFEYNVPFAFDGNVSGMATAGSFLTELRVKSLTVYGSNSFLWADSSGTLYPFTNGQFTETPEPAAWIMASFGFAALWRMRSKAPVDSR